MRAAYSNMGVGGDDDDDDDDDGKRRGSV